MRIACLAAALALAACATAERPQTPQDAFYDRLLSLCGKSFEGRIVSPPVAADASFAGWVYFVAGVVTIAVALGLTVRRFQRIQA